MAGTRAGGLKTARAIKKRYGKDFYVQMGRKGGRNGHTGGFAANPTLAIIAGTKGGYIGSKAKDKPSLRKRRRQYARLVRAGAI